MKNDFLIIPEYQRTKVSIPKPLKDLFILPFNKSLETVVEPFQGDDDLRPERSGIYFDSQSKQVCATDAHKLIRLKMPDSSAEVVQTGIYLSNKQIEKNYKYLTKLSNDFAKENPFEDYIKERKNVTVDGKFPNFNPIIPYINPEKGSLIDVDCEKLFWFSSVMSDAKILATEDIDALKVKEFYQQEKINYLSEKYFPFTNGTTHQIFLSYTDSDNEKKYVGVNAKFLKETLGSLFKFNGFKTRKFYITDPVKPIVIQGNSGSFYSETDDLALLSPIMISDYENNTPFFNNEFTNENYSIIYDLNENAIVSNGEVFPIDESVGYVEPKKEKQSVAPKAAVESTKEKVIFTPEFIRKRIGALQIALRLAEKKVGE